MCWEMVAKTRDTVDLVGLARHLPGAGEQRLLRGEGAQGAGAVRDLRRPQCSMVHIYMNELIGHFYEQQMVPLIRFQHRSIDGSMNIYACVQEHKATGVHAPHPGGPVVSARLAVAGAERLRGGPGALAEGGAELVPHRHGHRLEDHPERNGHARRVRRLRGGAAGDEGMGDERGDHRLAGHAAGDLRPRAVRDLPMTGVSPSPPTYPRSYDLLHADHLFSKLKPRYTKQLANLDSRAHASIILTADDIAGHDSTPSLVLFSCIYMHEGVRCCM